jgi:Cft2 family RNA processing exonuclease
LAFTPYAAGNTLGACAWKIEQNLVNIVYMVAFNHFDEIHLNGLDLERLAK